jgi:Holliday junction resolvasome RuvABC endonuclease subunit
VTSVLAFDPGATRCGWAFVTTRGGAPLYGGSGILGIPKVGRDFQSYRLAMERYFIAAIDLILDTYEPERVVNEIVPPIGSGNFVGPQSYLVNIVATVIHNCAFRRGIEVKQISAGSVQKSIAIRGRSKKITKVQVRNGVIAQFPDLKASIMKMRADETDAIAIGLAALGFTNT